MTYEPSDVLIKLLYNEVLQKLDPGIQDRVILNTKEILKHRFDYVIDSIKRWDCCKYINEEIFWVVDENYEVRPEFFREFTQKISLAMHPSAAYDEIFKRRLAEEILHWFYRDPGKAKSQGVISYTKNGKRCICLVRKEPMNTIDNIGCA